MISVADWLGAALYCAAALACTLASGLVSRQHARAKRNWRWIGLASVFIALAAARLGQFEERARDHLRKLWSSGSTYDDRAYAQVPAAIVVIVASAFIAYRRWRSATKGGNHLLIAEAGATGMLALVAIRIVSLHAIDSILYAGIGPVRAHYLIELTFVLLVIGAALATIRKHNTL